MILIGNTTFDVKLMRGLTFRELLLYSISPAPVSFKLCDECNYIIDDFKFASLRFQLFKDQGFFQTATPFSIQFVLLNK